MSGLPDLVGLPEVAAALGAALREAGIGVGPDRAERFARAVTVLGPATTRELRYCALATLVADPEQIPVFDAVFQEVFGGGGGVGHPGPRGQPGDPSRSPSGTGRPAAKGGTVGPFDHGPGRAREVATPTAASPGDRLATRDFAELTDAELALLAGTMRAITLNTPVRTSRRCAPARHGGRVDLRRTLAAGRRTGGHPLRLRRIVPRIRRRDLVVLCDISGSMEPYARAMLQLLYCASRGARAEVFTFATRLTRLTPVLRRPGRPSDALARAGRTAPDWAGGTRIAACLGEFNDRYGRRGMARGAVVVIVSDGWDTGEPALLGEQMAALARVAFRIVWVNPRTAGPRYRPLVGGMAAALPYCDAVVSAHDLAALDDFAAALSAPGRRRGGARRGTADSVVSATGRPP
ncbi:VWA domain-containing protein [Streptomyces sp. NPDC026673]|uniref:vWA domain-containing protein n=1 Tax=Streptomyces sp. NPDC026673 TaxID=3155724 RepID=UPI0033D019C5